MVLPGTEIGQTASVAPPVPLGVYDPNKAFSGAPQIGIEHVFIYWHALDKRKLRAAARYAAGRNREMLVTVEPYTKAPNWRDGAETLFDRILAGDYDREIVSVCTEIKAIAGRPMVRWGHEMEAGRYPWARQNAGGYIAAYRYFVDKCRAIAPEARYVWSPMGHQNLATYFPGSAHVDLIGLPIWGLQKWDRHFYGRDRDISEVIWEKYSRVVRYRKPVVVAELGVAGSEDYRAAWLSGLPDLRQAFPLLHSVVYFNDKEPADWPLGFGKPDWRVNSLPASSL